MAGEDLGWYDIAQICLNGHVINESSNEFPQKNAKFCARCGQPTLIACPDCGHDIRGDYTSAVVVAMASHYHAPASCDNCGRPYPWTREALEGAETLTDQMTDLSGDEVAEVKNNLEHLVSDSAQTKV